MKYYEHLHNSHEINMILNTINDMYDKFHPRSMHIATVGIMHCL